MGDALLSAMEESLEGFSVAFACLVGKKRNIQTLITFAQRVSSSLLKQLLNENFKKE